MAAIDSPSREVTDAQLLTLLQDGLADMGIKLSPSVRQQLIAYLRELQRWNGAYNLTAVRDPEQMLVKHLLDSLSVLAYMEGDSLLDVGSGAGLPGMVVAIARPRMQVSVLDANGKKCAFLRHVLRTLKLGNLRVVQARVEDYAPAQKFTCITARAFASLDVFMASTAPLLTDGGRLVAMLGRAPDPGALTLPPGFALQGIHALEVPGLHAERHVAILTRGLL